MVSNSIQQFIKNLDFYPKFREDNQKKTILGGIIALASFILILILFYMKIHILLSASPTKKFIVNTDYIPRTNTNKLDVNAIPKMKINFDITFYHLPCVFTYIDILDYAKDSTDILDGKIRMQRYNSEGYPIFEKFYPRNEQTEINDTYCGSCFSLKSGCCNTCKEVRHLFKSKFRSLPSIASIDQCTRGGYISNISRMLNESCRVHASITVKQHPGYILIGPGKLLKKSTIYKELNLDFDNLNISHTINYFTFGSQLYEKDSSLDKKAEIQTNKGKMKVFYFINIVPIGTDSSCFTYSSSSFHNYYNNNSTSLPSVLFKYDISPISAINEYNFTFNDFISQIISIIGGIYSIAVFIDLFIAVCINFYHKDDDSLKLL